MFRTCILLAITSVATSAVAGAQTPPPETRVMIRSAQMGQLRTIDVSEFMPAVAAVDSGGRCQTAAAPMIGPGQRAFFYSFRESERSSPTRSVVVFIDSLGNLFRYSDIRGDLRGPGPGSAADITDLGPRTVVTFDAVMKLGVVRNENYSASDGPLQVRGEAILDAPNLGFPRKMIEHVIETCGK